MVIAGEASPVTAAPDETALQDEARRLLAQGMTRRDVARHLADEGERKVSGKLRGTVPVIDINTETLREAFGYAEALESEHAARLGPEDRVEALVYLRRLGEP